jgi:hypothetical protein
MTESGSILKPSALEERTMPSNNQRPTVSLRIHGDNIIECERALFLIADSFSANAQRVDSLPYLPRYEIRRNEEILFAI